MQKQILRKTKKHTNTNIKTHAETNIKKIQQDIQKHI